ncbi:MAG: WD40 repeat domain-containing protein [Coxiellaceae bacterium]|nr:WD40 repeat domain-containing protein [Coxiellaceae bacterium]
MIKHSAPTSGIATFQTQYIATAGYDNRVILWDAATDQAIAVGHHDHLVNQCQFSANGKLLVTSSSDYSARMWSVPDMQLIALFTGHNDDVEAVAFHPTKSLLATSSRDHCVRIFDFTGHCLHTLRGHQRDVLSVVWLNESQLVSSSDDGTIKTWDIHTGAQCNEVNLNGVETDTISISTMGTIYCGNDDGEIIIIQGNNKTAIPAHKSGIKRLCYSEAHQQLISLSYDGTLALWKVEANHLLTLIRRCHYPRQVWARSCAFLGDDHVVFVSFNDRYIRYHITDDQWDLNNSQPTAGINAVHVNHDTTYTVGDAGDININDVTQYTVPSLCNCIAHIHGRLLTGGQSGELFDAFTNNIVYRHHSPLNTLCYQQLSSTVTIIYIGTYSGELIVLCSTTDGIDFICCKPIHKNAIKALAVNEHGVFSVSASGDAALHDRLDYKNLHWHNSCHHKIANDCIAINKQQFASVSRDLQLRIFSDTSIQKIKTPHKHSIKCMAIDDAGEYIATGDYRGTVCIYHLPTNTWAQSRLTVSGISCLTYDTRKAWFIAGSYDGQLYKVVPAAISHKELVV